MSTKFRFIKSKVFLVLLVIVMSNMNAISQGMNNNYPIDSIDIKNVFNMLGVEVFKIPLLKQDEKSKLKITCEVFENHKLKKTSVLTKGLSDDYCLLSKDQTLRIYKQSVNDSTIALRLDMQWVTLNNLTQFDKDTLGMQQCRAYSDFQPVKGEKKPIFIWYAFGKGRTQSMHCPGNSPLAKVTELYDFVIAISVEIEEVSKK